MYLTNRSLEALILIFLTLFRVENVHTIHPMTDLRVGSWKKKHEIVCNNWSHESWKWAMISTSMGCQIEASWSIATHSCVGWLYGMTVVAQMIVAPQERWVIVLHLSYENFGVNLVRWLLGF